MDVFDQSKIFCTAHYMYFIRRGCFIFLAIVAPLAGDGLIPPLDSKQTQQARKILGEFKSNPKGPYLQIRWFCKDGSVQPPAGTPCKSRGGGVQYAELSPAARLLARWNLNVGTVLASLDFSTFFDAARDHWRARELVLENYLAQVDRGWIYRRAGSYRGERQAEDEEKAGRQLLIELLANPDWVACNYFLVNQLVATIPHGIPDSGVLKSRTLAASIANRELKFQPLRSKIHSQPGPEDLASVERFIKEQKSDDPELRELADLLRQQYASAPETRLAPFQKKLAGTPIAAPLNEYLAASRQGKESANGSALTLEILRQVTATGEPRTKLDLLDLNALVLEQAFRSGQKPTAQMARRQQLASLLEYMSYATGAGLLSRRELDALHMEADALDHESEVPASRYLQSIRYLERSAGWCRAAAARDFGPVSRHYQQVEPLAGGLVDHLLRGSVVLPLTARLEILIADANRAAGIRHSIFGDPSNRGIVGLNPGVAIGRLGIISSAEDNKTVDPKRIYVIPQTLADLEPMAGILTLDSGNVLSHSQLLAANLGIPNATKVDVELFYAVTRSGLVILKEKASVAPEEIERWVGRASANRVRMDIDTSKLRLTDTRLIPLTELTAQDSGARAGPKAANLGQLAHFFPQNVAPGLVVPFGIYYEHIHRSIDNEPPLDEQIARMFRRAEQMRDSGATSADVNAYIYSELTKIRKLIQTMPLLPTFEKELAARMGETFGTDGSYGVFVRSDTNAEDLPEFTGAGLNLTVPNQVGFRHVTQSLKDVWASPFEERAWDWRSRILKSSENVYPSVLLLRSVPSDKSGVIATVNLETGADDITVNVSEGVSAVVDGGVAESLLLKSDGSVRLLEQARGTYRKMLRPGGDFQNVPVSGSDTVLMPDEIRQLRAMVAEVKRRYPSVHTARGDVLPWDIEFGFEKGQLRLFQIRPLARYQEQQTLEALSRLDATEKPSEKVRLDGTP
ncbi:MAG: hypothetical protein DMG58_16610 [Acidobacteria bacterium]|nr:MAG: hypothetical protein DMG58_16610 [Acidobacteriota bacterium]